jgi:outer membrane protein assembly factor BamB
MGFLSRFHVKSILVLTATFFLLVPLLTVTAAEEDADWLSLRHDSQNTGFAACSAPATNRTAWKTFSVTALTPIVAYGNVYCTGGKFVNLTVLDEHDGALLWTKTLGSFSEPTVAYGRIYVGTYGGEIWALDSNTGATIWKYHIYGYGEPLNAPQVADDRVFFNNRDGWLFCLNATTGDFIWKHETRLAETSRPAVTDGRVFTINSCLNESDGTLLWTYGETPPGIHWTYRSPVVGNGSVFLSIGPSLHCVDEFEGVLKWKFDAANDLSDPAVAYGQVYISSGTFVYRLDETYGHVVWKADLTGRAETSLSAPSVAEGKVFVSTGVTLFCLDVENGAIVWTYTADSRLSVPVIADDTIFVASLNGVYAFGESRTADVDIGVISCPETLLVSGEAQVFEVAVNATNVGGGEARNVRLEFQPNFGEVTLISRSVVDLKPEQTRTLTMQLEAANTGKTHEANFVLTLVYETTEGKAKSLLPLSVSVTVVPISPPPFYTTPTGIILIAVTALTVGIAVGVLARRKNG